MERSDEVGMAFRSQDDAWVHTGADGGSVNVQFCSETYDRSCP